jgi:hypothetical protein
MTLYIPLGVAFFSLGLFDTFRLGLLPVELFPLGLFEEDLFEEDLFEEELLDFVFLELFEEELLDFVFLELFEEEREEELDLLGKEPDFFPEEEEEVPFFGSDII